MRIINISGKAESGKDSVYEYIKKKYGDMVCHMLFAKHIKQYAKDYFNWDGKEETKPRQLLQSIGTDIIRDQMNDPNFHTRRLIEDIKVLSNYFDIFVITDCRFPNEVHLVKKEFNEDVFSIRIDRPNHVSKLNEKQLKHKSETALDNFLEFDYKIQNNSSLQSFYNKVDMVMEDILKGGVNG